MKVTAAQAKNRGFSAYIKSVIICPIAYEASCRASAQASLQLRENSIALRIIPIKPTSTLFDRTPGGML